MNDLAKLGLYNEYAGPHADVREFLDEIAGIAGVHARELEWPSLRGCALAVAYVAPRREPHPLAMARTDIVTHRILRETVGNRYEVTLDFWRRCSRTGSPTRAHPLRRSRFLCVRLGRIQGLQKALSVLRALGVRVTRILPQDVARQHPNQDSIPARVAW